MESFDLSNYISRYVGYTKILRLSFIFENDMSPPDLKKLAFRFLIDELKEGINTLYYSNLYKKANELGIAEAPIDDVWIQSTDWKFRQKMERLESELSNARSSMVKESIRLCLSDIGSLHCQSGNLNDAIKCFTRAREFW